jgi:hypothetical protein
MPESTPILKCTSPICEDVTLKPVRLPDADGADEIVWRCPTRTCDRTYRYDQEDHRLIEIEVW